MCRLGSLWVGHPYILWWDLVHAPTHGLAYVPVMCTFRPKGPRSMPAWSWQVASVQRRVPPLETMIRHLQGNLLAADVEALVNAVNCVGVVGKGIAIKVREAFPETDECYGEACHCGEVVPGRMWVVPTVGIMPPRCIIQFPSKRHGREPSRLEDVALGLAAWAKVTRELRIRSLAVPALGCGNGGLDWECVRPMMEEILGGLDGVEVLVFGPAGSPATPGRDAWRPKVSEGAS